MLSSYPALGMSGHKFFSFVELHLSEYSLGSVLSLSYCSFDSVKKGEKTVAMHLAFPGLNYLSEVPYELPYSSMETEQSITPTILLLEF